MWFLYILKNLIYYLWNVGLDRLIQVYEERKESEVENKKLIARFEELNLEIQDVQLEALAIQGTLKREIQEKDTHIGQLQMSTYWYMNSSERKLRTKDLEIGELQEKVMELQEILARKDREKKLAISELQKKNSLLENTLQSIQRENRTTISELESFSHIYKNWFERENREKLHNLVQYSIVTDSYCKLYRSLQEAYIEKCDEIENQRKIIEENLLELEKERKMFEAKLAEIQKQRAEETMQHLNDRHLYNYACRLTKTNLDILMKCIANCRKHFRITDYEINKAITKCNPEIYLIRTIFADPIHLNPWLYRRFITFDLYGISNTSLRTLVEETKNCILTLPGDQIIKDDDVNMEEINRISEEMNPKNWFNSRKLSISEQLQTETTNFSDSENDLVVSENDDDISELEDDLKTKLPNSEQLKIETSNSSDSEDALVVSKSTDISTNSDGFQYDLKEELETCENCKKDVHEEFNHMLSPGKDSECFDIPESVDIQELSNSSMQIQEIVESAPPAAEPVKTELYDSEAVKGQPAPVEREFSVCQDHSPESMQEGSLEQVQEDILALFETVQALVSVDADIPAPAPTECEFSRSAPDYDELFPNCLSISCASVQAVPSTPKPVHTYSFVAALTRTTSPALVLIQADLPTPLPIQDDPALELVTKNPDVPEAVQEAFPTIAPVSVEREFSRTASDYDQLFPNSLSISFSEQDYQPASMQKRSLAPEQVQEDNLASETVQDLVSVEADIPALAPIDCEVSEIASENDELFPNSLLIREQDYPPASMQEDSLAPEQGQEDNLASETVQDLVSVETDIPALAPIECEVSGIAPDDQLFPNSLSISLGEQDYPSAPSETSHTSALVQEDPSTSETIHEDPSAPELVQQEFSRTALDYDELFPNCISVSLKKRDYRSK